jgi:hypothetical protein
LLYAAKENIHVCSFGDVLSHDVEEYPLVTEIKYYLRLNGFGRSGFDARKLLRASVWPAILAPMTIKAEDVDALFFFIREYFMRYSYPLHQQPQQRHVSKSQPPPPKKARLESIGCVCS